jgi:hypothetical protein
MSTTEQGHEISQLCFKLHFSGIYEQRVTEFAQAHYDDCLRMLKHIDKVRANPTPGMRAKPAATLWNEMVDAFYKKRKADKQAAERNSEWQASKVAARESKQRGYTPTREKIKEQLDDLADQGKISIHQYQWGMKGLRLVHEMVRAAKESG